jgi:hypothetical protein
MVPYSQMSDHISLSFLMSLEEASIQRGLRHANRCDAGVRYGRICVIRLGDVITTPERSAVVSLPDLHSFSIINARWLA